MVLMHLQTDKPPAISLKGYIVEICGGVPLTKK